MVTQNEKVLQRLEIILLLSLTCLCIAFVGRAQSNKVTYQGQKAYENWLNRSSLMSIDAGGQIIDESGKPLREVLVIYHWVILNPQDPTHNKSGDKNEIVDGKFAFNCDRCSSLKIWFSKTGFYNEERQFVAYGNNREPVRVTENNLKIVLEAAGPPVPLQAVASRIALLDSGQLKAYSLNKSGKGRSVLVSQNDGMINMKRSSVDSATESIVFLAPSKGLGVPLEQSAFSGITGQSFSPKNLSVWVSSSGDGFIEFKPKQQTRELALREMREAPVEGYRQSLDLPTRIPDMVDDSDLVYFYCRIGGNYGKGVITLPSYEYQTDRKQPGAGIELLLNPTGSRVVEGVRF